MYGNYYYGIDWTYIVLVLPALILSIVAQIRVKSVYKTMSARLNTTGLTGAAAAKAVLAHYGITNVQVERVNGQLTDHFDPRSNVIRLSEGVYDSYSVAAVGIAAHEAGHAAQYAEGYAPIKLRNSIVPVANVSSWIGIPLAFLGYFLSIEPLIYIGLALYSVIMLFHLLTLPVELNASRRALNVIQTDRLLRQDAEYRDARQVLTAAAMTYVASLATSLMSLLRLIIIFTGRGNRRR
ncbi:MAG: zinc metallopeptidase [Clostridia bacterium]|nr:zinc metallopeptidase [Clostridia bacterium]